MELNINNKFYKFNAGIAFMRDANKTQKQVQNGVEQEIGLTVLCAGLYDGNIEDLITVLTLMNKGQDEVVSKETLESFIEDSTTDIDALFESVIDFLSNANVSKRTMRKVKEAVEEMEKQQKEKILHQ